ncbi:hypothetical protein SCLCIDRAFT_1207616 [Scleroderma citrinum Foug A]|uniref:Uncharacterized protein n=1 Tax=Scleroderma citrinum Foug A TaxID=1036808 RepID=A0A0C3ER48_9AGAM|nr:hypothetical protein SCLCIDRAFT_1207616 [Scleroderma citrinum Foug A]
MILASLLVQSFLEHELEFVRQLVINNASKCECSYFVVQESGVAEVLEVLEISS